MKRKVKVRFGRSVKEFEVVVSPYPHIVVPTVKEVIHGWYYGYYDNGRRECSSERILLNPYNGCSVDCPMCYARSFGGYFALWDEEGIVTVFRDFHLKLRDELSRLYWASCAYLCPSSEPFQKPLENIYHLSELSAEIFLDLDLPVEFITKRGDNIPIRLLDKMASHPYGHCFAQFTILSLNEEVNNVFSPNGAKIDDQFKAIEKCVDRGIFTVVRMDPLFPGITDNGQVIRELVEYAKEKGVGHFIFSLCDVGRRGESRRTRLFSVVKEFFPDAFQLWCKIYSSSQDGDINYRRRIFSLVRKICDEVGVTMALCMEFERIRVDGRVIYRGLNEDYMSSLSCEGINIPIYWRESLDEPFKPLEDCNGACLLCAKGFQKPVCGQLSLMKASALKLRDYLNMRPRYGDLTFFINK